MNRFFRRITEILTVVTAVFVAVPFFAVVKKGLSFAMDFPYPDEIRAALKLSLWTSSLAATVCTLLTVVTVYRKDFFRKKCKLCSNSFTIFPWRRPISSRGSAF